MITAFDFMPVFCPSCGEKFNLDHDQYSRLDYFGGAAQTCLKCGMKFQFVETKKILEIVDDLKRYMEV